jgi:hypothetical protein
MVVPVGGIGAAFAAQMQLQDGMVGRLVSARLLAVQVHHWHHARGRQVVEVMALTAEDYAL